MADQGGAGQAALTGAVAAAVAGLGPAPAFVVAVRRLEAAFAADGSEARPVGTTGTPDTEAVRFRAAASLAFAAADIAAVRPGSGPFPVEMEVNFLGLYGPASPLPSSWTERIVMGMPGADNIRDVLDLFDHPLIALAARILGSGRVEWLWREGGADVPSVAALALAGVMPGSVAPLERERLLPLAGLLAQYSRGAETVAEVVGRYFDVQASLEEWVVGRAPIPAEQQFRLGQAQATLSDVSLGESVADVASRVRLRLGPLPLARFVAFLPGGARRAALRSLVRLAVREAVGIELELLMASDATTGMTLGATRLGWTSWAGGPGALGVCPAGLV